MDLVKKRGFPAELRVRRKAEYEQVLSRGVSTRDRNMKLVALRSSGPTRFGTAVSRRAGGAVERNRQRRRLKEAFRIAREEVPAGLALVAIPLEGGKRAPLAVLEKSLVALARRALETLEARERAAGRAPPA